MNDDDIKFNRRFLAYFAVGLSVAGMAYVAAVTFMAVPTSNVRFADTALGFIMGTILASPIGFFYGTSKSAQAAQQTIRDMLPPTPSPTPPPTTLALTDSGRLTVADGATVEISTPLPEAKA